MCIQIEYNCKSDETYEFQIKHKNEESIWHLLSGRRRRIGTGSVWIWSVNGQLLRCALWWYGMASPKFLYLTQSKSRYFVLLLSLELFIASKTNTGLPYIFCTSKVNSRILCDYKPTFWHTERVHTYRSAESSLQAYIVSSCLVNSGCRNRKKRWSSSGDPTATNLFHQTFPLS